MTNQERSLIISIATEWELLPDPAKPPAVWIRQYPLMPFDLNEVDDGTMFPQAVWFLDEHGLREENVWKWRRFITVQGGWFWCGRTWAEPNDIFGEPHKIASAAFAPYLEPHKFYLETQWGGRFGSGWQVTLNERGEVQDKKEKWIS